MENRSIPIIMCSTSSILGRQVVAVGSRHHCIKFISFTISLQFRLIKQQQSVTVSSDSSSSSKSNMHRQIVIAVIVMHTGRRQPASHSHSQQLTIPLTLLYQCNFKLWQFRTPMTQQPTTTDKGPSDSFHLFWTTDTSGNVCLKLGLSLLGQVS